MLPCYQSIQDFSEMRQKHLRDDGFLHLCGQKFLLPEMTKAIDVYANWASLGIMDMEREYIALFLELPWVQEHIGAKLVLAMILDDDALGAFLLAEKDNRIVQMCRKRMQNKEHGLPWDSELEIA